MVAENDRVPDNTELLLDTFLSNEEQTFDDFTNQFSYIDNEQTISSGVSTTAPSDTSNLGSMLNYLNHRESQLVGGDSEEPDLESDMRGLVSSLTLHNLPDLPQPSTNGGAPVTVNGGAAGCLDMMMNYLREREMTLETSEEYSIDINTSTVPIEQDITSITLDTNTITSSLDNRLHSDSSNCSTSSSVPDNDRGARLQDLQSAREAQLTSLMPVLRDDLIVPDNQEVEEHGLDDNSGHRTLQTMVSVDSEDALETIELPSEEKYSSRDEGKMPKVDNFISNNDYYDSDKDVDESEVLSDDDEVYVPSFFDEKRSESFTELTPTPKPLAAPKTIRIPNTIPTPASPISLPIPGPPGTIPLPISGPPGTIPLPIPPAALTSPIRDTQASPVSSDSYHDCYSDFVTPLPGEFIEESGPEVLVHTRHVRQGSYSNTRHNFIVEYTSEDYEHQGTPPTSCAVAEPDNDVHPFQLDESFDYENIRCTPKPSPFTR